MSGSYFSRFKRLFLILSFFAFFFINTPLIIAKTTEEEPKKDWWSELWDSIAEFVFGLKNTAVTNEIKPTVEDTSKKNNNYNNLNKDSTTRALSDQEKSFNTGVYLNDVLNNNGVTNDTIAYVCNQDCYDNKQNDDCTPIKYSTVAYYFYTKNKKILYDRNNHLTPIEYDSSKFSGETLIPKDSCYVNLYNSMSPIPQGTFQDKSGAAAGTSKQLNNSLRTPIPASSQGADVTNDNSTAENTQVITEDNKKQEKTMMHNFIPESAKNSNYQALNKNSPLAVINNQTDSNQASEMDDDTLNQTFTDFLHPQVWQKEDVVPERTDDPSLFASDAGGTYDGTCNARSSHCRGMSQYGALGMSQSGISYQNILKFYYGNIDIVPISQIRLPENITISPNPLVKIHLDDNDDLCGEGDELELEAYLSGLGEMPDYWGNASKGGFEALKAQVIAARTYAMKRTNYFTKAICNSSKCQVFRCGNLSSSKKANLRRAVEATRGLVIIDTASRYSFSTEYARSFCGPSRSVNYPGVHQNPSRNGIEYERKARSGKEPFCK